MKNFFFGKLQIPRNDLFHVLCGLLLRQSLACKVFVEIPSSAQLGYNICVIRCFVHLLQLDYVLAPLDPLQTRNLRQEELSVAFVLEHFHIDDLDGRGLSGGVMLPPVDAGRVPLANTVREDIGVVFDGL